MEISKFWQIKKKSFINNKEDFGTMPDNLSQCLNTFNLNYVLFISSIFYITKGNDSSYHC